MEHYSVDRRFEWKHLFAAEEYQPFFLTYLCAMIILDIWSYSYGLLNVFSLKKKLQTDFRSHQLETLKFDQNEKLMFRPPGQKYCASPKT